MRKNTLKIEREFKTRIDLTDTLNVVNEFEKAAQGCRLPSKTDKYNTESAL